MRKWHRLFPTVVVTCVLAGLIWLPGLLGQEKRIPRASVKALALPAELPVATGYSTLDAWPGITFDQPVCIASAPGETDRIFVVSKTGIISVITHANGVQGVPQRSVFLDVGKMLRGRGQSLATEVEEGVLGLAFHPKFAENGYFYVAYDPAIVEQGRRHLFNRVSQFSVSKANPNEGDPASEVPLVTQLDEIANHNGGDVHFGGDGYLYFSIGDEGAANDAFDNARWIDKDFFAGIFRIDVDRKPLNVEPNPHVQASVMFPSAVHAGAYKVPADNPYIGAMKYQGRAVDPKKVRTEIYANGLRNVWRFSFDSMTGRLFAADVGQELWEEVDIVAKGGFYGWSYRESLHEGPRVRSMPAGVTALDPIYEYPHGNRGEFSGNSISGGFVYHGSRLTELNGNYIFGDYVSRRLWALREKEGKWTPQLLANNVTPVAFAPDPANGDVLVADIATGHVVRLVRTGTRGPQPPALLSQTGAFKDLKTLAPAEGLVSYTPNVSFWSDYAIKQRWFIVPNGTDIIGFHPTGNWTFPTGMMWVKHFEIETRRGDPASRRRLETRFLVKTATGVYGITYKWRPDHSDADLVPEMGQDEVLDIAERQGTHKQTWHYPSRSECLTCHAEVTGGALGFNTWQLNGKGGGTENQLEMMSRAGYFAGGPVPVVDELGAYAPLDDAKASLEWRVRSYLAANCVQCHQPGGMAQGQFDTRPTTPLTEAGLVNGRLLNDRGDAAARFAVPGDLAHSMVVRRVEGKDAPRMPPLSTNEVDPDATALLTEWIRGLGKN